jgi:hypothetical protein
MNSDRDGWTVDAMEKQGGGFVRQLGELARRADPVNLERIKMTWPEYWSDYEERGRQLEASANRT